MGQKVSPIGQRIGINKDWESKWYAPKSQFSKYLMEDIKIRDYIEKNLVDKGIASVEIERNKKRCEVTIHSAKPGVLIGKGGEEIEKLKKVLSSIVKHPVQVSVVDVKKADINAKLFAKGIKTSVSGRLGGADMARTEGYKEGTIPLHTFRADIDYATSEADTTFGKIGVKVWIYKGEILPAKNGGK